jgi:phasin family protein
MNQFSDQLSAVRQAQWEAQLDMFRNLSSRALDSAGRLAALNLRASRASMEQATGTLKHLLEAREPRDLFALGTAAQGQWQALFSYGRELAGLAAPASTANIPATYSQAVEQASIAADAATTISGEIAAAAVDIGAAHAEAAIDAGIVAPPEAAPEAAQPAANLAEFEAAIETAIADDVPPAEPTVLAKALNEVAPKPAGAGHPLASTLPLASEDQVELPSVAPLQSIAPPPKASRPSRRK